MPQTRGLQKPLTSICFLEWEAFWGGLVPAVTLTLMNPGWEHKGPLTWNTMITSEVLGDEV